MKHTGPDTEDVLKKEKKITMFLVLESLVKQRETEYVCKFYNNLHFTEINVYQELSYLISSNCAQCRQSITDDKGPLSECMIR